MKRRETLMANPSIEQYLSSLVDSEAEIDLRLADQWYYDVHIRCVENGMVLFTYLESEDGDDGKVVHKMLQSFWRIDAVLGIDVVSESRTGGNSDGGDEIVFVPD